MASIRERNGKFNVIYSYTNEKGERKQKWETYETKAEAKRRKKEIEYKKYLGIKAPGTMLQIEQIITQTTDHFFQSIGIAIVKCSIRSDSRTNLE